MIEESSIHSQADIENSIKSALINNNNKINGNSICMATLSIFQLTCFGLFLFTMCVVSIICIVRFAL